jgi:hypothetical protein
MTVFSLNKRQVNKLRKQFPALFQEVVGGKVVPIDAKDIHIALPEPGQTDLVEVFCAPGRWLGDIPLKAAWRL